METQIASKRKLTTRMIARIAILAAVECVIGPFAIPLGGELAPITLFTLVVYLFSYCLTPFETTMGTFIYILLGAVGLPVFSGAQGGLGKLLGPTGGYIFGYLFLAVICAFATRLFPSKRLLQIAGMVVGTAVLYLFGTVWFMIVYKTDFLSALLMCVLPYLLGDAVKIAVAAVFGPMVRGALIRAKLIAPIKE